MADQRPSRGAADPHSASPTLDLYAELSPGTVELGAPKLSCKTLSFLVRLY